MFCGKEAPKHVLECICHSSTVFTYDELYSMYCLMQTIMGCKDIFTAFLARLRRLIIAPTQVYICNEHVIGWIGVNCDVLRLSCCGIDKCTSVDGNLQYVGCVNHHNFIVNLSYYGRNRFTIAYWMSNCYDANDENVKCPELLTYFPEDYEQNSSDSDDGYNQVDECRGCYNNIYACDCGYDDSWGY